HQCSLPPASPRRDRSEIQGLSGRQRSKVELKIGEWICPYPAVPRQRTYSFSFEFAIYLPSALNRKMDEAHLHGPFRHHPSGARGAGSHAALFWGEIRQCLQPAPIRPGGQGGFGGLKGEGSSPARGES